MNITPRGIRLIFQSILVFACLVMVHPLFAKSLAERSSDELFGFDQLWTIHLTFTPEQWKGIEPEGPGGFPGGPPPFMENRGTASDRNPQPPSDRDSRPMPPGRGMGRPGGPFGGIEYPEVSADFELDGTVIQNVGIRYKGQASFMMARNSPKKSFKVDFNKNVEGQKFFGLTKLNLNNNFMDPSMMVDALSYETFREFGIAAPRTAFAKVYLSVKGETERQYLGLYTIVEQIDERFLERNFQQKSGLLLKPQMVQGFPYFGRNWEDYEKPYEPKSKEVSWNEAKRFMDFTQLINEATDSVFVQEITDYMDVDQFLHFLAVNVAIANYDSILAMGQNYYVYGESKKNKYLWIPWDLNLAFGKFMMVASPTEQMNADIRHPNANTQPLIERILASPMWQENYLSYIREFLEEDFQPGRIRKNILAIHEVIQEAVKEDPNASYEQYLKTVSDDPIESQENGGFAMRSGVPGGPGREFRGGPPMFDFGFSLAAWTEGRVESIRKQLAGEEEGVNLSMRGGPGRGPGGFGPRGPGGPGGPGGFGPGMFLGPQVLAALDQNGDGNATYTESNARWQQWAKEWDGDSNKSLSESELSEGLSSILHAPEGFPPMGPPGGFSPSQMLLDPLMDKANPNGEIDTVGFVNIGNEWFKTWDTNHSEELDNQELSNGINQMMGPPPEFMDGPPGF